MEKEKILNWYQNEIERDKKELELEKKQLIENLKNLKKDKIIGEKPKKMTIWQRIKKILTGI
jgi:uncharacterized protein YacL (UPF0231 family)